LIFWSVHYHEREAPPVAPTPGISSLITKPSEPEAVLSATVGSDPQSAAIQELPPKLVGDLQLAVRNGEKDRLDQLIEQAGERNVVVSRALKDLADRYDYDALTQLLEGVGL
jgi:hypothetical protein